MGTFRPGNAREQLRDGVLKTCTYKVSSSKATSSHFCNATRTKDGLREVLNGLKASIHRLVDGHRSGVCGLAAFPLVGLRQTDRKESQLVQLHDANPRLW